MKKNRICIMLFFSAILALPGFAQQASSNSSTQPPSASAAQSASDLTPLPDTKPTDFWDGDDPNLVNLVTHPFANKKYVQRQVGPIRDRLNELDELTSENGTR